MIKFSSYYKRMMRNILFFFTVLIIFSIISSCKKPPVYPNAPQIELKSVTQNTDKNTITFTINFKDGDGDLGLSSEDSNPPFQLFDFVINNGDTVELGSNPSLPPYSCNDYTVSDFNGLPIYLNDNDPKIPDTVLVKRNPNFYNYFVDILIKQSDGTYQLLDLSSLPNCINFNERFFRLKEGNYKGPITGDLSYTLDFSFSAISGETVKFRITIQDRSLNKSNTVETNSFKIN